MLIEALLWVLGGALRAMAAILPDVDFPFSAELSSFATTIGQYLRGLDGFLPVSEYVVFLGWVLSVYLPFVVGFYVVRFIYSHIPVI